MLRTLHSFSKFIERKSFGLKAVQGTFARFCSVSVSSIVDKIFRTFFLFEPAINFLLKLFSDLHETPTSWR